MIEEGDKREGEGGEVRGVQRQHALARVGVGGGSFFPSYLAASLSSGHGRHATLI